MLQLLLIAIDLSSMLMLLYIKKKALFMPLATPLMISQDDEVSLDEDTTVFNELLTSTRSQDGELRLDDNTSRARSWGDAHYRALQTRLAVACVANALVIPLVFAHPLAAFSVSYFGGSSITKKLASWIPGLSNLLRGELQQPFNKVCSRTWKPWRTGLR